MSSKVEITPEELDRLVDEGKEDVLQYFDLDNLRRGDSKRINIDMPVLFLAALDREAGQRGITRQSLIKTWLYDRLMRSSETSSGIRDEVASLLKQAVDLKSSIGKSQRAEGAHSVKRKVAAKK